MDNTVCLLCKEDINKYVSVTVQRGLGTLIESCRERKDDFLDILTNVTSILVHKHCRKAYTKKPKVRVEEAGCTSSGLRSVKKIFDFKRNCLFCGDVASKEIEVKKPAERRNIVHDVMTKEKFSVSIINAAQKRNDTWSEIIVKRVNSVIDLVAAEAKYHQKCYTKYFTHKESKNASGRPVDAHLQDHFLSMCNYIESNEECQYTLNELLKIIEDNLEEGKQCFSKKTLKNKLIDHYGDNIIITHSNYGNKDTIVSFKSFGSKILSSNWYNNINSNEKVERLRIVKAAAEIILEDIRSETYDTNYYCKIEDDENIIIPETLRYLIDHIVTTNKKSDISRKCNVIGHLIVSATRPKSFVSPIMSGLALHLHRQFGSRNLVDLLNNLGLCSSYFEAKLYESSLISADVAKVDNNSFIQFAFDNADFNVKSIDGYGTFHNMGGIKCITPKDSLHFEQRIERLKKLPSSDALGKFGSVKIMTAEANSKKGLQNIVIEDVMNFSYAPESLNKANLVDLLHTCGSILNIELPPSWAAYMDSATKSCEGYNTSFVMPLPFINLNVSDINCIYTSLKMAQAECKSHNQKCSIVTFDQPLYLKAMELVSNQPTEFENMIIRLGGFHLLMSFMGAVGHIMSGSGLQELWCTVYASASVVQMMSGHAYARALRAHFITQFALMHILLQMTDIDDNLKSNLQDLHTEILETTNINYARELQSVENLNTILDTLKTKLLTNRTSRLWLQYLDQVQLIKLYVRAERSADWSLHLYTVQKMLPYFHAAGHLPYAKSAHLYLQEMNKVEMKMPKSEFEKFTKEGYFTIRRSDKFWAGIWSDMTIEQILMRSMKTSGGLTRGRGFGEGTLATWILGMPSCSLISNSIEDFSNIKQQSSEQHIEFNHSRRKRDKLDFEKFLCWLNEHPPFSSNETNCIISLSSGLIGDSSINCDTAMDCGIKAIENMIGNNFYDIKLKRVSKVKTLATINNKNVNNEAVTLINPMQLFNRLICVIHNENDLKTYMQYELSPLPTSLFDTSGMRKTNKSVLSTIFEDVVPCTSNINSDQITYVIDGGYLLNTVVWSRPSTYLDIFNLYVSFVNKRYGKCTVVFDGYSDCLTSTKNSEHNRRSTKRYCPDIKLISDAYVTTNQYDFLRNAKNKIQLIEQVTIQLRTSGIAVHQAKGDADLLIVKTALNLVSTDKDVVVVGQDTDLLVLLIEHHKSDRNVWFMRPDNTKKDSKFYNIASLKQSLHPKSDVILFMHSISGCDTTSALFRQGKKKAFNLLNSEAVRDVARTFYNPFASHGDIAKAGELFLLKLYDASNKFSCLNELRYFAYNKVVSRSTLQSNFDLAVLPPTKGAAKYHSYRTFLQVQAWLGNDLDPLQWGWENVAGQYQPITTTTKIAPTNLLKLIKCSCKKCA